MEAGWYVYETGAVEAKVLILRVGIDRNVRSSEAIRVVGSR